jgi:hypothetical protein
MLGCLPVCLAVPWDILKGCIQITRIADLPGLVDDLPWDDVLETVEHLSKIHWRHVFMD